MSYGIQVFNSSAQLILSTNDLGMLLVEAFEVAPTSSGSKQYEGLSGKQVIVAQTQSDSVVANRLNMRAFNAMSVSVTPGPGDLTTVSWSPRFSQITALPVNLFVYVL